MTQCRIMAAVLAKSILGLTFMPFYKTMVDTEKLLPFFAFQHKVKLSWKGSPPYALKINEYWSVMVF